jgi:hypothetical protein
MCEMQHLRRIRWSQWLMPIILATQEAEGKKRIKPKLFVHSMFLMNITFKINESRFREMCIVVKRKLSKWSLLKTLLVLHCFTYVFLHICNK